MNMFTISGNISEVKLVTKEDGKKYAKFFVTHHIRKFDGTYNTGFFYMTAFGAIAEALSQFKKGSPLEFVGHFNFTEYEDKKSGKLIKRIENIVDSFAKAGDGAYMGKSVSE